MRKRTEGRSKGLSSPEKSVYVCVCVCVCVRNVCVLVSEWVCGLWTHSMGDSLKERVLNDISSVRPSSKEAVFC